MEREPELALYLLKVSFPIAIQFPEYSASPPGSSHLIGALGIFYSVAMTKYSRKKNLREEKSLF